VEEKLKYPEKRYKQKKDTLANNSSPKPEKQPKKTDKNSAETCQ